MSNTSVEAAKPEWPSSRRNRAGLFGITLAGFDELELFPSEDARRKALEEIAATNRLRDVVIGIVCIAVTAIVAVAAIRYLTTWLVPAPTRWIKEGLDLLRMAGGIGAGFLMMRWLHRHGAAKALRQKLLACGVPVCLGCGYSLRALGPEVGHCPECGRATDDAVREVCRRAAGAQSSETVQSASSDTG